MKYIDIANPAILEQLKENNIDISNFEATNDEYVDIRKFIKEFTSFEIKEKPMYRHQSKIDGNNIIINICNNEDMKRFLIAYEFIKTLSKTTKRENSEFTGLNRFLESFLGKQHATSLLLPDDLRDKLIKQIIHEEGFENTVITDSIKRIIVRKLSEKAIIPIAIAIDKVERYQF
jgi:hypothetical protein